MKDYRLKDCGSCGYRKKVWTLRHGEMPFCMHPKSIDAIDGVAMFVGKARDPGQPCGPGGDLHSSQDVRMGYVSPAQWRTVQ